MSRIEESGQGNVFKSILKCTRSEQNMKTRKYLWNEKDNIYELLHNDTLYERIRLAFFDKNYWSSNFCTEFIVEMEHHFI